MFSKNVSGKNMAGILLYVLSLGFAGYGYYQLSEYGQQVIQELSFPYQAIVLLIAALMMTMIGSTLILLGKGDQIIEKLPAEEPEDERHATGKKEESDVAEEVQLDKKTGLSERIKMVPIWLMVILSIVLAMSITSIAMLAIFGF